MKKKILLLTAMLVVLITAQANDDLWVDVNFTRDSTMWKEAFPALAVNGLNLQSTPSPNGEYLGFGIDGAFGKFAVSNFSYTPFNTENITEQFIYAIRLHNNATSYWSFPGTSDVGKIKINAICGNATSDAQFTLQKFMGMDGEGEEATEIWAEFEPAVTFIVPPHEFSTTSFVVEKTLNLTEPTKLRFKGPTLRNVHIFAMSISKNPNAGVGETLMSKFGMSLNGRSFEIKSDVQGYNATIFNPAGLQVGSLRTGETFTFATAGVYLVRVETAEGTFAKKIAVF